VDLPAKICPECRVEYLHTALECSDCHVALVAPGELPAREERLADLRALTPIRVESGGWISRLAARLEEKRIPHRVEAAEARPGRHSGAQYALFVRAEDAEAARAVDSEILRQELPELSELPDATQAPVSDDACPACGSAVSADAAECPDCGLNFEPG
jgi:predicted amidophosphoribosyltransferase